MKISSVIAITLVGLATQGEAFSFGKILRTTSNTMRGVNTIINGFLGVYRDDGIVCPDHQFQARVIGTSAYCQIENDPQARALCQNFGSDCIAIPGRWGCGRLDGDPHRACLFQPAKVPSGVKLPKIIFDDDDDFSLRGNKNQYSMGRSPSAPVARLEDDDYTGSSDFYAKTLINTLERSSDLYDEGEEDNGEEPRSVILAVTAIVKALDMAGIRYPIGKTVCQVCKGTCNKIMSNENVDRCKYDACVKFLGGYTGSEAKPSCTLIPKP
ncbi:hypothetical protein BGW38_005613 [Lunasporangiospora selenospora]|uniref:Uncharacterized protein n=1 Tax=Lunasporangiospora selenospora TaxID=979761 RepID=A0A9P6KBE6_9FUNG|nr:hypothetical protein BGW38_005613 [Lunasporangiospora selenospora]